MSTRRSYPGTLMERVPVRRIRLLRYALLAAVLFVALGFSGIVSQYSATSIVIDVLFALGVSYPLGQAGIGSFGNQLFFGAGGYSLGYLATRHNFQDILVLLLAAMAVGGLLALVESALIRGSGALGFGLIALAIAQAVYIFVNQSPYVYGSNGMYGIVGSSLLGVSLTSTASFFSFTVIVVLIAIIALTVLSDSMVGQVIRATRQSPARALALGIPVRRYRVAAYVVGGAISGLARRPVRIAGGKCLAGRHVLLDSWRPSSACWTGRRY